MHCGKWRRTKSRREMLQQGASGFGAVALTWLLGREGKLAAATAEGLPAPAPPDPRAPLAPRPTHHAAKAKSVIFLFMDGGVSQVDSFDPKPRLDREHGQPIKMKTPPTQFNNVGAVLKSPWKFQNYGQSGIPVSDLFPHVATCVDDLAIVRSMTAGFSEHTNANYFIHSGHPQQGRPSMGSWLGYGLGTECQDLPAFVVLGSGMIPPGGLDCFNSGFLPATYQGSMFRTANPPVADLQRLERSAQEQVAKLDLLKTLDAQGAAAYGPDDQLESAVRNYELAYKMQTAVPDLMEITGESKEVQQLYGIDEKPTELFGRQCLLARRMVERGVRFVELLCPNLGHDRWDQHSRLREGHADNARAVDKPIAGLLKDLKSRGLLDETLVVWAGEFGRTPMAQGGDGRDHNPFGFTIWMAGGGIKGGTIYGATDDYGYYAVEDKVQVHDLHATMLHLLGLDHKKTTFRWGGRDMRLTDVHGEVLHKILT